MRTKPAFTLIEILVVCTILAIAATIAVPSMASGFDSVRVPSAARMVMADILLAQNTAITTQTRTYVYFLKDENLTMGYTIVRFRNTTPGAPTLADAVKDVGLFTDASTRIFLRSPSAKRGCYVGFGTYPPGGMGPMNATQILTPSVTVFGFDSLGQPVDETGTPLTAAVTVPVSNSKGTVTTTLSVTQITGEVTVQ